MLSVVPAGTVTVGHVDDFTAATKAGPSSPPLARSVHDVWACAALNASKESSSEVKRAMIVVSVHTRPPFLWTPPGSRGSWAVRSTRTREDRGPAYTSLHAEGGSGRCITWPVGKTAQSHVEGAVAQDVEYNGEVRRPILVRGTVARARASRRRNESCAPSLQWPRHAVVGTADNE